MSNTGRSSWRVEKNTLVAHLSTPGVDNVSVRQKGREVHVTGSNDNYGVRYNYVLPLHPDARDSVRHQYHQGLLVLTCDNVNSLDVELGCVAGLLDKACVNPSVL